VYLEVIQIHMLNIEVDLVPHMRSKLIATGVSSIYMVICSRRAAAAPDAADADAGAGAEESGSKAAEETPAGNVEESRDVDWQLGARSVGDGGDDAATTGAPQGEEVAGGGSAVEAEPEADVGGGAEGESAQVRLVLEDHQLELSLLVYSNSTMFIAGLDISPRVEFMGYNSLADAPQARQPGDQDPATRFVRAAVPG